MKTTEETVVRLVARQMGMDEIFIGVMEKRCLMENIRSNLCIDDDLYLKIWVSQTCIIMHYTESTMEESLVWNMGTGKTSIKDQEHLWIQKPISKFKKLFEGVCRCMNKL